MKLQLFSILYLFLSLAIYAQTTDSLPKFDPTANPFDDLKTALGLATESNKRVILDIGGEWCIWCHRIDAFMQNTEEIKSLLEKNYVVLKINYSKENKNEKFLSQYPQVEGYPHFFVLDETGKLLHSQNTGELEKDKDYDRDKFVALLEKWKRIKEN